MIQRPNAGETEDDLIRLQHEFEKNKSKPAVSLIRRKNQEPASKCPEESKRKKIDHENEEPDSLPSVLCDVKERDCSSFSTQFIRPVNTSGFPKVLHRSIEHTSEPTSISDSSHDKQRFTSKKKPSLFAQQMRKLRPQDLGVSSPPTKSESVISNPEESSHLQSNFITPHLITGDGLVGYAGAQDVKAIHQENLHRLSQMTSEELQEEQKRVADTLDSKLLQFILNKSKQKDCKTSSSSSTRHSTNHQEANLTGSDIADYPIAPDSRIPHFDRLEKDKLAWMKQIPDTKTKIDKSASEARFDFNGLIIPPGEDVPSHLGLHHHGDEPDRAGYTIEELFTLSRSAFPQQRNLAVTTLSACIRQSQCSAAHVGRLAPPLVSLLPTMLDAGLAFLSRWLLDDAVSNAVQAGGGGDLQLASAIDLLHSILCSCIKDENRLNQFFSWRNNLGLLSVSFETKAFLDDRIESRSQKESDRPVQTDNDALQLDLVQGLVSRTHLLYRLAYLLEMGIQLTADSVVQLIQILIRIGRHSRLMAYQIIQSKHLLKNLVQQFLPKNWNPVDKGEETIHNAYGLPSPDLLRLMRALTQSSRSIALNCISEFQLVDRCLIYLAQDYRSMGLPPSISAELQLESLRCLSVIISYGIRIDDFLNNLPSFIKLFHELLQLWKQPRQEGSSLSGLLVISWIDFFTLFLRSLNSNEVVTSEALTLLSFLVNLVKELMSTFVKHFHEQNCHNIRLLASCLEFLCAYIDGRQLLCTSDALIFDCESLIVSHIIPFITSLAFENTFATYRSNATILSSELKSTWEPIILSPCCHIDAGMQITMRRIVVEEQPADDCMVVRQWPNNAGRESLCLISSLVHLVGTVHRVVRSTASYRLLSVILSQGDVLSFLRACENHASHPHWSNSNSQCTVWSAMFELDMVAQLLLLSSKYLPITSGPQEQSPPDLVLFHNVALRILPLLIRSQEDTAKYLIKDVIFSHEFVFGWEENEFNWLSVSEQSGTKFREDLRSNLLSMSSCYLNYMSHLLTSNQSASSNDKNPDSFAVIGCCLEDRLLPADWAFLPLITIYQATLECSPDEKQSDCPVTPVVHCLRWLTYLESCPGKLAAPNNSSIALRFSRLLCAFLCTSELFFHDWGKFYLQQLLTLLVQPIKLHRIKLEEKIPGVSGFYDIYVELILQYLAVSYGDPLFCNYLLLPCHQTHHVKYRRALWGEYRRSLRVITMPLNQLATPLQLFLDPEESHEEMIKLYLQAVLSQSVIAERNPLPYVIAVHHLNQFLYRQSQDRLALQRHCYRALSGSEDVLHHIVHYRRYNLDCPPLGFELFDRLPDLRVKHLDLLSSI